jgi:hypothetical protein
MDSPGLVSSLALLHMHSHFGCTECLFTIVAWKPRGRRRIMLRMSLAESELPVKEGKET